MTKSDTTVELKLPIIENMELVATQTAEVVSKHMKLDTDKTNEISLALIEACINAFEHSESKSEVYIHFIISEENLTIKVIDKGKGFDSSDDCCYQPTSMWILIHHVSTSFFFVKPVESIDSFMSLVRLLFRPTSFGGRVL